MNRAIVPQVAALAAAALVTLGTVSASNALALNAYRAASIAQLQSTPMAVAQHVTIVAHRTAHA